MVITCNPDSVTAVNERVFLLLKNVDVNLGIVALTFKIKLETQSLLLPPFQINCRSFSTILGSTRNNMAKFDADINVTLLFLYFSLAVALNRKYI